MHGPAVKTPIKTDARKNVNEIKVLLQGEELDGRMSPGAVPCRAVWAASSILTIAAAASETVTDGKRGRRRDAEGEQDSVEESARYHGRAL